MNRRYLSILVIILGVVVLIATIYLIFFHDFSAQQQNPTPEGTTQTVLPAATYKISEAQTVESPVASSGKTPLPSGQAALTRTASSFAERFGSFSNHSDFGNVSDLEIFMSAKMREWAKTSVAESRSKDRDASTYYGITTKAISSTVVTYDESAGQAAIIVATRRRESSGDEQKTAYDQKISIKFVREDGGWKVDEAYWQ